MAVNEWEGQVGDLNIKLTPNSSGYGQMNIDWQEYDYYDKYFRVFRKSDQNPNYESIQIDYTKVTSVKCLQIYPIQAAAGQMRSWVVNTGYGKGIIQVDSVSLNQFNSNPQAYLQDSQGNWKYDVIFFGTWDSNGPNGDLQSLQKSWTIKFIEAGRGCIFGHDTLRYNYTTYFRDLIQYVGMIYKSVGLGNNTSTRVQIVKNGLFNTYPNYLGPVGTILNVPAVHQSGQYIDKGQSWLQLIYSQYYDPLGLSYLATYNNCAHIQTGHSSGAATSDEQKILANLIFYCNQLIFNQYETDDYGAQDYEVPNAPTIVRENGNYTVQANDNGSIYTYYVEQYDKNNVDLDDIMARSAEETHSVKTGTRQYKYIFDNSAQTIVTSTGTGQTVQTDVADGESIINSSNVNYKYLHVAAIDGAGNIGPTTTVECQKNITYNQNNSDNQTYMHSIPNQQISYEVLDNSFEYNDHRFLNWNTSPDGTGTKYNAGEQIDVSTDMTLYAIWEEVYSLYVNPNGGDWTDSHGVVPYKNEGDLSKVQIDPTNQVVQSTVEIKMSPNDTKIINDPALVGYNFNGWIIQPTS